MIRCSSLIAATGAFLVLRVAAQTAVSNETVAAAPSAQATSLHVQSTLVVQGHPAFRAPYAGPNSLERRELKETVSFDLVGGVRAWRGAEFYVDGLAWQGFGLSNATGIDGFPNGEAFRLGTNRPNARVVRLFLRQTFGFGGNERVEADTFALAGRRDATRLALTLGKLSVKDIFDNNSYANDPRTQFLNWALMANEAWDYPADSLGYTNGFAAEWTQPGWVIRAGVFQLPRVANGLTLDSHLAKAWGSVAEIERDYMLAQRPGAARFLVFLNRADMGNYREAVAAATRPADIVATRAYRSKAGCELNLEQELAKDLGAFLRLGWNDGKNEAWAFADVDRAISAGLSVRGTRWQRAADTVGIALVGNGLSDPHRRFFAAGGTGILAGDSTLRYGSEKIAEIYYNWKPVEWLAAALDYQFVQNPAFNRDRGPVSVFGLRVHVER